MNTEVRNNAEASRYELLLDAKVIGIADYRHVTGLPSAVRNDARDVRDLLVDPRRCGYPPEHVTLLLDGEATRGAILGALSGLAARTHPASVLLVYISSHGGRLVSGAFAGEYILPVDTMPASDEDLARTAISGAEFTVALKAIPARKALVIFEKLIERHSGKKEGLDALGGAVSCHAALQDLNRVQQRLLQIEQLLPNMPDEIRKPWTEWHKSAKELLRGLAEDDQRLRSQASPAVDVRDDPVGEF